MIRRNDHQEKCRRTKCDELSANDSNKSTNLFSIYTNARNLRSFLSWYFSCHGRKYSHEPTVSLPRTTKARMLMQGIIADFATRADACADADETREPDRWRKA